MLLQLDKERCESCSGKECLKECPHALQLNALKCRHCLPRKAACKKVCAFGAIEESASGILAINEEKCTGCSKCVKACKEEAIVLVQGKAKKCDLCAGKGFELSCVKSCSKQAIKASEGEGERREVEKVLGWRVFYITDFSAVLKEDKDRLIALLNGERFYVLKNVPQLTREEAFLLANALNEFQIKDERKNLYKFFQKFLLKKEIKLNAEQEEYFLLLLNKLINGFGVLDFFLQDDELEELCLIGLGKDNALRVFHRVFGWMKTNFYFSSEKTAKDLINKMARNSGRRLSLKTPHLNAVLPNGSRLNASIKPVAFSGINFTIRKFKAKPFTMLELIGNETLSSEIAAFLWLALQCDLSLVICGNTGSGKTSLLNALFGFIPANERIIITEETPELAIPQEHKIKLNTSEEVSMQELITETLRMRPDRVIVGEVRNEQEVKAFIDTMLAGQGKGSFCTFHSLSGKECISRLKNLGASKHDLDAIDLIIVQRRWDEIDLEKGIKREARKVVEIAEYNGGLNELFSFDFRKGKWLTVRESRKVFAKLEKSFGMQRKGIKKELLRRKKLLEKLACKEMQLREFFEFVNRFEGNKDFRKGLYEKYAIK